MRKIVVFVGNKFCGKNTAGSYIKEKYGYKEYAFASPMKEGIKAMFGMTEDQVNGNLKETIDERYGVTPRQLLQDIGTDWAQFGLCERYEGYRNVVGRKLWVNRFIDVFKKTTDNYVITDCRFQHEVDSLLAIKDAKVLIVKIERQENTDGHLSEKEIATIRPIHYKVSNYGTLDALHNQLDSIINTLNAELKL